MTEATYIIGIDLGTTNSTLAYAPIQQEEGAAPAIQQLKIPQLVQAGVEGEEESLPSFLYFPLEQEKEKGGTRLEWMEENSPCIGIYARERAGEIAGRVVASAKSWLCHDGIDRRKAILPLNAGENCEQISPVDATAAYLRHLAQAWNHAFADAPFEEQKVLVTVPASFDPSARQLVQEATIDAGFPEVILLEEPQAAFYAWLHRNGEEWREKLTVGDSILVVDVGGGTTDFTLISVADEGGELQLERKAVGAHLLLGGDNMDLALAHLVKGKLEAQGHRIDEWQLQTLVHLTRKAKETLLAREGEESVDITIHGRGSGLVGGTLKTQLTRKEAFELLVEGFVPLIEATEQSQPQKRTGIQEVGLPFAQDPRISSQMAKFLSMTGENGEPSLDAFVYPSALLFNGGTMKAAALRDRLVELLNGWGEGADKPEVKVLEDPDFDHAVSRGAVYYGLVREGKGVRIRGGTSRSYYVGVEGAAPAVPGVPPPMHAVCVVPFGMEEGTHDAIKEQTFSLSLGEPATFRFFSHATPQLTSGEKAVAGTVVHNWQKELTELHPIETAMDRGADDGQTVCVRLESRVTELGVLELWCVAEDERRWKLEFDIRKEQDSLEPAV